MTSRDAPPSLAGWLICVPARLASERLPRKPLQDLGGRPLIVRVRENLEPLAKLGAQIMIATDSAEVMAVCTGAGFQAVMTSERHASGTDRCHEASRTSPRPFIMNVQGDEPFVAPRDLILLAQTFAGRGDAAMGTLVHKSTDGAAFADPNTVKAVRSARGLALYFSRAPVPFDREGQRQPPAAAEFLHHLGVYAFRRETLEVFCSLPPSPLENLEKLEQLRALEAGWNILLVEASKPSLGIDTPQDLEAARAQFKT